MIFTDTITLYNHYKDTDGDKWKKTVLDHVLVVRATDKTITSDGVMKDEPVIRVSVPYRNGYKDAKEYDGTGWTLGLDNLDIITLGKCDREITDSHSFKDIKIARPNTWTVKAFEDHTGRRYLKHWQITCEA